MGRTSQSRVNPTNILKNLKKKIAERSSSSSSSPGKKSKREAITLGERFDEETVTNSVGAPTVIEIIDLVTPPSSPRFNHSRQMMEIFLLRSNGPTIPMNIYKDGIVEDIMKEIEILLKIPIDKQMLKFKEQILKQEETFAMYNLKEGNAIRLEECIDLEFDRARKTKSKKKSKKSKSKSR